MNKQVTIKNPCPQNLEEMPRVAGGIFCTICSEKVEDLTNHTEEQLAEWLKVQATKKPCGIYRDDQAKVPAMQRVIMPFRYAAISIASLFAVKEAHAQTLYWAVDDSSKVIASPNDTIQKHITGKVLAIKNGKPVAKVTVHVAMGDSVITSVVTNEQGVFECDLPYAADSTYILTFSGKGYRLQTIYGYTPCDKELIVRLNKSAKQARKYRRVVSKF